MGPELSSERDRDQFRQLIETKDFVERHVSGNLLQDVTSIDILATVRSPLKHIVSEYKHLRREPEHPLSRAANLLDPHAFFAGFGDFLMNHQTRYLIGAFRDLTDLDRGNASRDSLGLLVRHLPDAVNRLRWLVPTIRIDDFTSLWSLETRRYVPNADVTLNVAPASADDEELEKTVGAMPWLYSVDLTLWQIAQERFGLYRERVLDRVVPWDREQAPRCVYSQAGSGIWLRAGWHNALAETHGLEWWAGPRNRSEVRFVRRSGERFLKFELAVLCGIKASDLRAFAHGEATECPIALVNRAGNTYDVSVDLSGLSEEGGIDLHVPEVWASIMVNPADPDMTRRSFCARNWELMTALPAA